MTEKECLMLALADQLDGDECQEMLDLMDEKFFLSKRLEKMTKELKNALETN